MIKLWKLRRVLKIDSFLCILNRRDERKQSEIHCLSNWSDTGWNWRFVNEVFKW